MGSAAGPLRPIAQLPAPLGRTVHARADAYGAKGPGWGVSARSGRRPLPSTAQGTEPPDRGRTPPTPAPTHNTPARATQAPTEPKQAAAGTQGRGELRKNARPHTPAPAHASAGPVGKAPRPLPSLRGDV